MTTSRSHSNSRNVDSGLHGDYYRSIYAYVRRRLSDSDLARDFAQDACLRILRMQRSAREIVAPQRYGFRIAANLMRDRWVHRQREAVIFDSRVAEKHAQKFTSSASDPMEMLEIEQRLVSTLSLLPPLYCEVLLRRKRDGFSLPEIADELGISVHTVKKYLFLAVERCRAEGKYQ